MEEFIASKMKRIHKDFACRVKREKSLCKCKAFSYEGGGQPDYSDRLIQQYYLLRFFPAYLAEYYLMYKNLKSQKFLGKDLNVLSIGCGCGLDLWGLYLAFRHQLKKKAVAVRYTGVDIIDWRYWDTVALDEVYFANEDISTWKKLDEESYNIIVFPKSINEFSNESFDRICAAIANTKFTQGRVVAMCSLMVKGKEIDSQRFRRIANLLQKDHDYECMDELDEYWMVKKDQGIRAICPEFVYPQEIYDEVIKLQTACPQYALNGHKSCEDGCSSLNRKPILRTTYINYKLLRFERS